MAYFSNGTEGMCFDDQCARCKYFEEACPIALVQIEYNYEQFKDASGTARKILRTLVKDDGTCTMYEMMNKCSKDEQPLFPELIPQIENTYQP